jgi:serine/threonine protein kinase
VTVDVIEAAPAGDLAGLLRKEGSLPVSQAVGIILQACEAVAEAHSIGIVHRDLKPANLFVTTRMDGTPLVKVLDFGISKMSALNSAGAEESLTSTGLVMGSPGYMSPEQVRNAKAVDARSDVWALGVILYEVLTGVSPFRGDTAGEVFARVITETPPPLREVRRDIPEGLERVVAQCLERDVARRVPSVSALAKHLLPWAPEEDKRSVARILRVSARPGTASDGREDTLIAPEVTQVPSDGSLGTRETGPAWLRSSVSGGLRVPMHSGRTLAVLATLATLALLATAGVYVRRARVPERTSANAPAPPPEPVVPAADTANPVATPAAMLPSPPAEAAVPMDRVDAAAAATVIRPPRVIQAGQPVKVPLPKSPTPVTSASPTVSARHENDIF